MKVSCIIAAVAVIGSISNAAVYKADLGASGEPVGASWTGPTTTVGFHAPTVGVTYNFADGVTLTFTSSVDNYGFNRAANPVVQDGFFGNVAVGNDRVVNFTLSGLIPGSTVDAYAINGWDGAGRGGFVSFGGSPLVDSVTADQLFWDTNPLPAYASDPQLANLAKVADDVVAPASGVISGYWTNINGTTVRDEGQVGGLAFDVTAVPEPVSLAVLGLGGVTLLARRRK